MSSVGGKGMKARKLALKVPLSQPCESNSGLAPWHYPDGG